MIEDIEMGGRFEFRITLSRDWVDGTGDLTEPRTYEVSLPHQCNSWEIIGGTADYTHTVAVPLAVALADLDEFIAEAQATRNRLAELEGADNENRTRDGWVGPGVQPVSHQPGGHRRDVHTMKRRGRVEPDAPYCPFCHRSLAGSTAVVPMGGIPGSWWRVCGPWCPKVPENLAEVWPRRL